LGCNAVKRIKKERFDVIWNYKDHSAAVADQKARILATQYCKDMQNRRQKVFNRGALRLCRGA